MKNKVQFYFIFEKQNSTRLEKQSSIDTMGAWSY
jgi:hypothetical protein